MTPVNAKLYGVPTVPAVGVPVKFGATSVFAGAITSVKVFTAAGATPLIAVTVIGNEPAVVGVPESTPAALIVIPPATGVGLNANVGAGEPVIAREREAVRRPHRARGRRAREVRRDTDCRGRQRHREERLVTRAHDVVARDAHLTVREVRKTVRR